MREGLEFSHFGVPIGAGVGTFTLYYLSGIPPAPEPKVIFFPPFFFVLLTINTIQDEAKGIKKFFQFTFSSLLGAGVSTVA